MSREHDGRCVQPDDRLMIPTILSPLSASFEIERLGRWKQGDGMSDHSYLQYRA